MGRRIEGFWRWFHQTRIGVRWHDSKLRKFIDEERGEHILEELMAIDRPGNPSMEFIVRIVNMIRRDLVNGQYIPSTDNAPAYFPPVYYIFMSDSDSQEWQGVRLIHLQSRVAEGVMKKLDELDKNRTAQTVRIEVRADANLNKGQIVVQAVHETTKTDDGTLVIEKPTAPDYAVQKSALYRVQLHEGSRMVRTQEIHFREIYVGRGETANIKLERDERIGRIHAKLVFEGGKLILESANNNPTRVGQRTLTFGETCEVKPGDRIKIYSFTLIPLFEADGIPKR